MMLTTPQHVLTMTKTHTKTKTKTGENFQEEESIHVQAYSVQYHIYYTDKQAHEITFDKDKDKEKDKDNVLKRPNMCYIFEKQENQGLQI